MRPVAITSMPSSRLSPRRPAVPRQTTASITASSSLSAGSSGRSRDLEAGDLAAHPHKAEGAPRACASEAAKARSRRTRAGWACRGGAGSVVARLCHVTRVRSGVIESGRVAGATPGPKCMESRARGLPSGPAQGKEKSLGASEPRRCAFSWWAAAGASMRSCWAIAGLAACDKIFCAPGNAGIAEAAECVPIAAEDSTGLVAFCRKRRRSTSWWSAPRRRWSRGLVDRARAAGIKAFGPSAEAARSKARRAS